MDGFEKRRNRKKEDILNASLELFKQYGYQKVTVAEIAQKASVSQVSIYKFFTSKENLINELEGKLLKEHYETLINIINGDEPIRNKFEKLIRLRIEFIKTFPLHMLSLENDASFNKNLIQEIHSDFKATFLSFIEDAKGKKALDDSLSTETILTIMDMIEFYFKNNPSAIVKFDHNERLVNEFFTFFVRAFMKESEDVL